MHQGFKFLTLFPRPLLLKRPSRRHGRCVRPAKPKGESNEADEKSGGAKPRGIHDFVSSRGVGLRGLHEAARQKDQHEVQRDQKPDRRRHPRSLEPLMPACRKAVCRKKEASRLKPYYPPSVFSLSCSPPPSRSGAGSISDWRSTAALPCTGKNSGFLLLFLLPLLLLACGLLVGSHKIITASQQRIAMQSRLDICALSLIKKRQRLAHSLATGNQVIRASSTAIYFARGIRIFSGTVGQVLGGLSEQALLRLNQAAARLQDLELARYQAMELAGLHCGSTPYSKGSAFCLMLPALASATKREPALMPDVYGPRVFLRTPLARADCRGKGARTVMRLEGDPLLTQPKFSDRYEK